jgi:3-deoxy-manno-octulosonate cytidylyltransferase (CMP-KDO synthetase)
MIGHVYESVAKSDLVSKAVVATCDAEIYRYIESIGGEAVMTKATHERATDRCAEALLKLEDLRNEKFDIVVMVQGDEPMLNHNMISEALQPMLIDPDINVVNLLGKIGDNDEFEDRNCIKVVCDLFGNALYFSREPIPTRSKNQEMSIGKQVCIIPYRREFLLKYSSLTPTPLELAESIDMLRILEHGMKVRMVPTNYRSCSVDTIEDLKKVERLMRES